MAAKHKANLFDYLSYVLMILCFPLNPLVLLNVIDPQYYKVLTYIGSGFWVLGMIFVVYPIAYFKRKGNVDKGKAYVHTNKVVNTGLYSIVRHVQYTGGILSIFVATPFLYPHWIFIILGIPGIFLIYLGTKREDRFLIEKFGAEYKEYKDKVPAINLIWGMVLKFINKERS